MSNRIFILSLRSVFIILFLSVIAINIFAESSQNVRIQIDSLYKKAEVTAKQGKYSECDSILSQIIDLDKKQGVVESGEYAKILNQQAKIRMYLTKIDEADLLFREALKIRKDRFGENSLEYAETLNDMAAMFNMTQNFGDTETYLIKALEIRENLLGKKNIEYSTTLSNLGCYYLLRSNFKDAKYYLEKAAEIRLETAGEKSEAYLNSIFTLGLYYFHTQDYKNAEVYFEKGCELARIVFGEAHPEYISCLNTLGSVYSTRGKYLEAISCFLKILPLAERSYGKKQSKYISVLSNLGGVYYKIGDYDNAELLLQETLSLAEEVFGKSHSTYFNALNILGSVYIAKGFYEKAELILRESLELRGQLYGINNPSYVNALKSFGLFYCDMGNYSKAQDFFIQGLDILKVTLRTKTSSYASTLGNLATTYIQTNNLEDALALLQEASQIYENLSLNLDDEYFSYLINIGNIHGRQNIKSEAFVINYYQNILTQISAKVGKANKFYLMALNNLGQYLISKGYTSEANELYAEVIDLLANVPHIKASDKSSLLMNVAFSKDLSNSLSGATDYYIQALDINKKQIQRNFSFLSEGERELLWNSIESDIAIFYTYAKKNKDKDASIPEYIYNYELFFKNILLNSSTHIHESIINNNDDEVIKLWQQLKLARHNMIQMELDPTKDPLLIKSLEEKALLIEKDLLRKSQVYDTFQKQISTTWKDISHELQRDEIAIEFINFKETATYSLASQGNLYYALILHSDCLSPKMVYICDEKELENLLSNEKYSHEKLYSLLWKPLEPHLKEAKDIYIAPSGLLHNVSFSSLGMKGKYLSDNFHIHNLLSTKDIISLKHRKEKNLKMPTALLIGGVDYDLSKDDLLMIDSGLIKKANPTVTRDLEFDNTRGQGFTYLLGSKQEIELVNSKLINKNWTSTLLLDKLATETRFKAILDSISPQLLHISTHGFYFPLKSKNSKSSLSEPVNMYKFSENPLMRSGLAFSGANRVWNKEEDVIEGLEDGILTSYEMSNLNLSETQLVILSACDTGLGDISSNEGVYGLQRALRLAGAQSMIVSLWKVPDLETMELMNEFYSNWIDYGQPIKISFSMAQNKLRKKYPHSPEKWGGFVLIE